MASNKRTEASVLTLAFFGASLGAVYKVGDSTGWTSVGNIDCIKWASTKSFHVGDSLLFAYYSQFHNVMQVTHNDFQSCSGTSAIASNTSGSDSVTPQGAWPLLFPLRCSWPLPGRAVKSMYWLHHHPWAQVQALAHLLWVHIFQPTFRSVGTGPAFLQPIYFGFIIPEHYLPSPPSFPRHHQVL